MASEDINKALTQLEQSLEKLQSAREQVKKVVEGNEQFSKTTNDLVKSTQSLIDRIKDNTIGVLTQFSAQLDNAKNSISEIEEQSKIMIEKNISQTTKSINKVSVLAQITLKTYKSENLKVLAEIVETHNQIKQMIAQLNDMEMEKTLKSIDSGVVLLKSQHDSQMELLKKQLKISKVNQYGLFILIGVEILLTLMFKFVF